MKINQKALAVRSSKILWSVTLLSLLQFSLFVSSAGVNIYADGRCSKTKLAETLFRLRLVTVFFQGFASAFVTLFLNRSMERVLEDIGANNPSRWVHMKKNLVMMRHVMFSVMITHAGYGLAFACAKDLHDFMYFPMVSYIITFISVFTVIALYKTNSPAMRKRNKKMCSSIHP